MWTISPWQVTGHSSFHNSCLKRSPLFRDQVVNLQEMEFVILCKIRSHKCFWWKLPWGCHGLFSQNKNFHISCMPVAYNDMSSANHGCFLTWAEGLTTRNCMPNHDLWQYRHACVSQWDQPGHMQAPDNTRWRRPGPWHEAWWLTTAAGGWLLVHMLTPHLLYGVLSSHLMAKDQWTNIPKVILLMPIFLLFYFCVLISSLFYILHFFLILRWSSTFVSRRDFVHLHKVVHLPTVFSLPRWL